GIILAGTSDFNPGESSITVARLNGIDGSIDNSFGAQGHNIINFHSTGKFKDAANAVAIDGQGRIVVAGVSDRGGGDLDFGVVRLKANGGVDSTFGSGGLTTVAFNHGGTLADADVANAVAIDKQGRILVAGSSQFTSTDHDFAVARLDANGKLDPFFGV